MADWVTISSLATAGGTLVLAVATFSSVRSANRSARVAERSLLVGLRPVLVPSRDDDSPEIVRFGDAHVLHLRGHGGALSVADRAVYLAMALRNGGSGLAVIHGWRVKPRPGFGESRSDDQVPPLEQFRRQQIDLYIPSGDTGCWLGALRDPSEPIYDMVRQAARSPEGLQIDLLYGDHEGGQRTITRFALGPWPEDEDNDSKRVTAVRYWNLDREDPR
ncbi:MAG TPA: hypothetical protein VFN55_13375 [Solirubrobacteraceae bacterium]|nr:hypothetical protein [Solirubrobacteraceae bacterium]